jgi:PPOX class probable FMN-dependent enzyme
MEFSDTITTVEGLREVIAPPSELVAAKEISELDDHCRDFIARSPFIVIASTDGKGSLDTSPKGDPPGFVQILDDSTLAIPERPGNHRADTLVNLVHHPYIGVIFLIPGTRNTLRVRGNARIVRDELLRDSMAVNGKVPDLAIVVDVTVAYFHCAKCIIRSELWTADQQAASAGRDDRLMAETMVKHADLPFSVDEMQDIIVRDEAERLY